MITRENSRPEPDPEAKFLGKPSELEIGPYSGRLYKERDFDGPTFRLFIDRDPPNGSLEMWVSGNPDVVGRARIELQKRVLEAGGLDI